VVVVGEGNGVGTGDNTGRTRSLSYKGDREVLKP
jgi:hypothetical protein